VTLVGHQALLSEILLEQHVSLRVEPAFLIGYVLRLAIEGGCNAVASTLGVLDAVGRVCPPNPVSGPAQSQRTADPSHRFNQNPFAIAD